MASFSSQHGWATASIIKCGVTFYYHSQTSKLQHPTHLNKCNYLSMVGLNHVSKSNPTWQCNDFKWTVSRNKRDILIHKVASDISYLTSICYKTQFYIFSPGGRIPMLWDRDPSGYLMRMHIILLSGFGLATVHLFAGKNLVPLLCHESVSHLYDSN